VTRVAHIAEYGSEDRIIADSCRGAEEKMKYSLILIALLIAGCAAYRPMPAEELTIGTEINVPGLSSQQIFDKSKQWIVRHLYSKENIIEVADRNAGIIVANGYIDYPATGKLESIERIQYLIYFVMREKIHNSRLTLTFSGLELYIPRNYRRSRFWPMQEYTGGYSVPLRQRSDYQAARKGLLEIAERLGEYLRKDRAE
jgi:hypothetical protein